MRTGRSVVGFAILLTGGLLSACSGGAHPAAAPASSLRAKTGSSAISSAHKATTTTTHAAAATSTTHPPATTTTAVPIGSWAVSGTDSDQIAGLSCPTPAWCMGIDDNGNAYTYSGGSWSGATSVIGVASDPDFESGDSHLTDVSCASASFCVAGAVISGDTNGDVFTYSGGTWSETSGAWTIPPQGVSATAPNISMSCPTVSFCGGDGPGVLWTYSDGTWSSFQPVGMNSFGAVSCTSDSWCMAVGGELSVSGTGESAAAYVYANGSWTLSSPSIDELSAVSCASSSWCMASGTNTSQVAEAYTYSNGVWSAGTQVGGGGLDCPSSSFCLSTVYANPDTYVYTNGSWSTGAVLGVSSAGFNAVACASSSWCLAVGGSSTYVYS